MTTADEKALWWDGRFDLRMRLEWPSVEMDHTIRPLTLSVLMQNPDLRRFLTARVIFPTRLLAYQALAEGAYGTVRLAALFPTDPFNGGEPKVFALDGERRSKHRNPPWDGGEEGISADLCLYFTDDPAERRWTVDDGLVRLFDVARRHLACEDIWRKCGRWPTEDAPHGDAATPAPSDPALALPPLSQLGVLAR